jgi:hypothetical protein
VLAKDAKGFQKSLGGDIFTVSWLRNGQDDEPPTQGDPELEPAPACFRPAHIP